MKTNISLLALACLVFSCNSPDAQVFTADKKSAPQTTAPDTFAVVHHSRDDSVRQITDSLDLFVAADKGYNAGINMVLKEMLKMKTWADKRQSKTKSPDSSNYYLGYSHSVSHLARQMELQDKDH